MSANSSCASRPILWMPASFSVLSPSEIVHSVGHVRVDHAPAERRRVHRRRRRRGKPFSGLSTTHGARLIDSTPPTRTTSASPVSIARLACIAASRLEPQRRLTVLPGTLVGRPASSAAMRATLRLSSPAPLALPKMTSSIWAGSRSGERSSSALITCAPRSSGRDLGERAAEAAERGRGRRRGCRRRSCRPPALSGLRARRRSAARWSCRSSAIFRSQPVASWACSAVTPSWTWVRTSSRGLGVGLEDRRGR